jgi:hypothetical protein
MIDMPSARMAPDGALSLSASYFENNQRYALGFQIFPWLEGSFRYAGLQNYNTDFPVYYDRSFALKARLWNEGSVLPALAIGVNDLVGTGVYGGEYLVASKQFGNVDASVGIGWGRLGTANTIRNPLGTISQSFYARNGSSGEGGNFNFKQYFRGANAGIFGGINWRTPLRGLTLTAEYSSDAYDAESSRGNFTPRNQVNLGASYQLSADVVLGFDWLYGRSLGGSITFQLDPTTEAYSQKINPIPRPEPVLRSADEQQHALRVMLAAHNPNTKLRGARTDQGQMIDDLWRQPGIDDIEIRGRAILVTAASNSAGNRCLGVARILQQYQSDITTVIVKNAAEKKLTRCATPSAPDRDFIDGVFVGGLAAPSIALEPATLIIDATAPPRRSDSATRAVINKQAQKQSITILAANLTDSTATIYYTNTHYFSEIEALTRLTEILMREAPPDIERFRLIAVGAGVPNRAFDILRAPLERKFQTEVQVDIFATADVLAAYPAPMNNPILSAAPRRYARFQWAIFPQFRQEFFDPDNPFGIQFVGAATASLEVVRGWTINGEAETSLYDNFNTSRSANSSLPHVRTDFLKYFKQGKTGIGALDTEYRFRLAPTVFAVAKLGYLESMFAGGGGEILWRPDAQRWALGVDAYEVRKRNFDRLAGLQNYQAFTGHVSLYYASPWYNLDFVVRAGQYLAGDRGLTLEVSRRFATGVEIGLFATKTNISASQFGEGSFDKGLIIRIPLGWALPIETQSQYNVDLRPIQRDGGQRLLNDASLYEETRRPSEAEIQNQLAYGGRNSW